MGVRIQEDRENTTKYLKKDLKFNEIDFKVQKLMDLRDWKIKNFKIQ